MDGPLQIQDAEAPFCIWQHESVASTRQRTSSQMETYRGIQSTNSCTLSGQTGEEALQRDSPVEGNGEPRLDLNLTGGSGVWASYGLSNKG